MLNTPSDYHTFDHVVKKKSQSHAYKWSCLAIVLVICALIAVVCYWDVMMGHTQRFVKFSRTDKSKNVNFAVATGNISSVVDVLRDTLGGVLEKGGEVINNLEQNEEMVNTIVDNAKGVIDQVKEDLEPILSSGINNINSIGSQSDQAISDITNELSNLATEIKAELNDLAANVENLVATTIENLENAAHNTAEQARSGGSAH